jgi:hypothetical protein
MKASSNLIFFLVLFCCCTNGQSFIKKRAVKGIIVERKFPNLVLDTVKNCWVVLKYDPYYTKIFYYKDQVLIESNYYYSETKIGEDFDKRKYRSRYYTFIFSDSSNQGVLCDSNSLENTRIVNKDSMLNKEWAFNTNREKILEDNECTLLFSNVKSDGDIVETYSMKNKKDSSMTGNLLMIFSKTRLIAFNYSMAKDIEEKRKMKLIKIEYINDARKLKPNNTCIEKVDIPYGISEIQIKDESALLKMFDFAKSITK